MKPKSILLVVAAFLIGAFAAGSIGVRVIREVRTEEGATSNPNAVATTSTLPEIDTYQVDPRETMIGSTALVPVSVEATGTRLAIEYDLILRAPYGGVGGINTFVQGSGVETIPVSEFAHVYPRHWEIETTNGVVQGGPANYETRTARFDVAQGFTLEDVVEVRITDALTPFSIAVPFTLSADDPRVEIIPGVDVELINVSDQGSTTIVQVAIVGDDPELTDVFVRGAGPGWRSAVFEAEGRPRVNLTYVGEELPDPIPLTADATIWQEIPGVFVVDIGGFG